MTRFTDAKAGPLSYLLGLGDITAGFGSCDWRALEGQTNGVSFICCRNIGHGHSISLSFSRDQSARFFEVQTTTAAYSHVVHTYVVTSPARNRGFHDKLITALPVHGRSFGG